MLLISPSVATLAEAGGLKLIPLRWLRIAYHDMATADVAAGRGGIDASIAFETLRAENVGGAFDDALGNIFRSPRGIMSSMADIIALGAAVAVGSCSCGSVIVPFRAGRIEATGPEPSGVPRPEEDLDSHTRAFARQGFDANDMIGLVACGHTLGGVHGKDFPEIVPTRADAVSLELMWRRGKRWDGRRDADEDGGCRPLRTSKRWRLTIQPPASTTACK